MLREWGNDLGFTQLPKFTLRESLTPEPPPLSTISLMCAVIGFYQPHVHASKSWRSVGLGRRNHISLNIYIIPFFRSSASSFVTLCNLSLRIGTSNSHALFLMVIIVKSRLNRFCASSNDFAGSLPAISP